MPLSVQEFQIFYTKYFRMDRAKDIIQFTISRESNEFVLSLPPNNYSDRVTVLFPLLLHSGIHIALFDDKYPSAKAKDILKGNLIKDELFYILQITKNNILFTHYLLGHFIGGELISECTDEDSKLIGKLLKKLYQPTSKDFHTVLGQLYIKIMLQYLVDILGRNESFCSREEILAKNFLTLLRAKSLPDHHVGYYAEHLFVSRRYLTWSVHKILGSTPKNLIDSQLTEKAKELLRTRDTIYSIAEQLHFDSAASFSTFFKKNTGITPSVYRRQIK